MLGFLPKQLYHDFRTIPRLVDRYVEEPYAAGARRTVRNVNGVSPHLSRMVTGDTRFEEGVWCGLAFAGLDVLADDKQVEAFPDRYHAALKGDPSCRPLVPVGKSAQKARSPRYERWLYEVAKVQDDSMEQFGDPSIPRLRNITMRKGGASFTAHMCALADGLTDAEIETARRIGFVMQLLDDYMDATEDEEAGIATLVTEGVVDAASLRKRIDRAQQAARETWGDTPGTNRFCRLMDAHYRLGRLEHRRPGTASRLLPWYF